MEAREEPPAPDPKHPSHYPRLCTLLGRPLTVKLYTLDPFLRITATLRKPTPQTLYHLPQVSRNTLLPASTRNPRPQTLHLVDIVDPISPKPCTPLDDPSRPTPEIILHPCPFGIRSVLSLPCFHPRLLESCSPVHFAAPEEVDPVRRFRV